jgi:hypothetical protein
MAGHQGKIAAIEQYLKNKNLPFGEEKRSLLWHEQVNLAGALTQIQKLKIYTEQVDLFTSLSRQSTTLSNIDHNLEKKVTSSKRKLDTLQLILKTPLADHKPVKVFSNKAVIHPVNLSQ